MSDYPCAKAEVFSEDAVSRVSLLYCEPTGTPTILPVSADCLPDILAGGISYNDSEELLLLPDPATFTLRPADEGLSAFYCCRLCTKDGEPSPLDSCAILQKVLRRAALQGFAFSLSTELTPSADEDGYLFSEQPPLETADLLFATRTQDPAMAACTCKLTLTLLREDKTPHDPAVADGFTAGLLALITECAAVLFPDPEAYPRLGTPAAPRYITYSAADPFQLIYRPAGSSDIVLRLPAPAANPYLALALLLEAGLDGITRQLPVPAPLNGSTASLSPSEQEALRRFPATQMDALFAARYSSFLRKLFGADLLNQYVQDLGLTAPYPERPDGIQKRYFSVP